MNTLFEADRLNMADSIRYSIESLRTFAADRHLVATWSGGKDSTTLVTLLVHLIESGHIAKPKSLTVLYADTRLELLPLSIAAADIREQLQERDWIQVRTVMAPMDRRFMVYMLGRGVPPSNNNTLRWCQRQIKIDPMTDALDALAVERGLGEFHGSKYIGYGKEKFLTLIGLRLGESAARDGRIALSCGTNGAECGQGWYQQEIADAVADKLSPILHWRVCHVWEWLRTWAPRAEYGDWATKLLADAYGGEEAEEINARTGCVGCPLASKDTALDAVCALSQWSYLAPLKQLRPLWRELREPQRRLRMPPGERRKDGSLAANQNRLGPLKLECRLWALEQVKRIQQEVNESAAALGRPRIDILNDDEEARIRELISARTFPRKWEGDEPGGEEPVVGDSPIFLTINGDVQGGQG